MLASMNSTLNCPNVFRGNSEMRKECSKIIKKCSHREPKVQQFEFNVVQMREIGIFFSYLCAFERTSSATQIKINTVKSKLFLIKFLFKLLAYRIHITAYLTFNI